MKKFLPLLLITVLAVQSCKKESSSPGPVTISADITTATTFNKVTGPGEIDYIVTKSIQISADLVIKPGVIIVFKNSADFIITTSGSLNATGVADNPIAFIGEQSSRGFWGGLYFSSYNLNNKLLYCKVYYAGGSDHTIPAKKGAVIVYGTGLLQLGFTNIEYSGGFGLYLTESSSVLTDNGFNIFAHNAMAPVTLPVSSFYYLESSSDYTGNDVNYIDGIDDGPISSNQEWSDLNVPYLLPEGILQITGNLTVEAGTHIKARQETGLQVTSTGRLTAIGTANKGITFEGNQAVKGYWAGIQYNSNNALNKLEYCTISDGGSATSGFVIPIRKANIEVNETGSLTVNYSTITNSNGWGINVITGGALSQTGNTFLGNTLGNTNL